MSVNAKTQVGIRLTDDNYQRLLFLVSYFQVTQGELADVKKSHVVNFAINEVFERIVKENDDNVKALRSETKSINIDLYREMTRQTAW